MTMGMDISFLAFVLRSGWLNTGTWYQTFTTQSAWLWPHTAFILSRWGLSFSPSSAKHSTQNVSAPYIQSFSQTNIHYISTTFIPIQIERLLPKSFFSASSHFPSPLSTLQAFSTACNLQGLS